MNDQFQQNDLPGEGSETLRRLYYLAGRYVTLRITQEEIEEVKSITNEPDDECEELSLTFVTLTSTGYLKEFFRGMGKEEFSKYLFEA